MNYGSPRVMHARGGRTPDGTRVGVLPPGTRGSMLSMNSRRDRFYALLCTAGGFGLSPFAPGTIGTIPAVGVYLCIAWLAPPELRTILIGVALLLSCLLCVALGSWAERHWRTADPGVFVLDEVAGFLVCVLLFQSSTVLGTALWAFLASRAFDVIKPWPVYKMEELPGGVGILLDDLLASLYAVIFLHAAAYFFPIFFAKLA